MKRAEKASSGKDLGRWLGPTMRSHVRNLDAETLVRLAAIYLDYSRQLRGAVLAKVGQQDLARVVRNAQRGTGRFFDARTTAAFLADGSFQGSVDARTEKQSRN